MLTQEHQEHQEHHNESNDAEFLSSDIDKYSSNSLARLFEIGSKVYFDLIVIPSINQLKNGSDLVIKALKPIDSDVIDLSKYPTLFQFQFFCSEICFSILKATCEKVSYLSEAALNTLQPDNDNAKSSETHDGGNSSSQMSSTNPYENNRISAHKSSPSLNFTVIAGYFTLGIATAVLATLFLTVFSVGILTPIMLGATSLGLTGMGIFHLTKGSKHQTSDTCQVPYEGSSTNAMNAD